MDLTPPVLEGSHIRLEPLSLDHHTALCDVGLDPEIWRWSMSPITTPERMRRDIETALSWQADGTAIPFATVEQASGRVIGSTRFANIDQRNRRAEIGWTWIAPAWQRTAVNTEAKFLMLRHAFEKLGCIRVEFKADALNEQSRKALLRIGATQEGVFRSHMIAESGRVRDSVYFSIVEAEWPEIREMLESRLLSVRSIPSRSAEPGMSPSAPDAPR